MTLRLNGSTSGYVEIDAPAVAANNTLTLPSSGELVAATSGNINVTSINSLNYPTAGALNNRNKIINGAMQIDQRNAGASVTPAVGQYTLDRWVLNASAASKVSVQQNAGSVTPPAGFVNYAGLTSTSAYTVASGDYISFSQIIEGFNVADLGWGTANAKSVTISFWVRSSLTGTFGGVVQNGSLNRSYPFNYTISSANTWEQKSVTIPGDTSGTWATGNTAGISLLFGIGVGTTYQGTAGSWASANYSSATGATNIVATNGATFYITGVQLEAGTVATPFERRSYGQELSLCQRYYQKYESCEQRIYIANVYRHTVPLTTTMRDTPIVTKSYGYVTNLNADNTYARRSSLHYDLQYTGGGTGVIDVSAGTITLTAEL